MTLPGALFAWGQHGHRVVGELAERHLDETAAAAVGAILGGESLARISTWPDEIRSYPSWRCASPFHYVTVAPGADYPHEGLVQGDAAQALVYFTDILRNLDLSDPGQVHPDGRVALAFVVHLVGDLHQPLHSGRGCDRGGNELEVDYFGELVKLHAVWDSKLIESQLLSFSEWVDFLDHATSGEVATFQEATPLDWIREAQAELDGVYTCYTNADRCPCYCGECREDGTSSFGGCLTRECTLIVEGPAQLRWAYQTVNLEVVRSQLLKGGVRLAGLLNWIFEAGSEPPEAFARMAEEFRALPNYDAEHMDSCRGVPSLRAPSD